MAEEDPEKTALAAECAALRGALVRCADSARGVLSVLPEAGAAWFSSGRVFLRPFHHLHQKQQTFIRVIVRFGAGCGGGAAAVCGPKRCACWVSSPASQSAPFAKLPPTAVACDDAGLTADIPADSSVWKDPSATLEWVAFAFPAFATAIGALCQEIETRGSSCGEDIADRIDAVLAENRCGAGAGDTKGRTLLHAACGAGNIFLAKWLVTKCKAPVDAADHDAWTPLHCALSGGHFSLAQWLLEGCGADAHHRTSNGGTALHSLASAMAVSTSDEEAAARIVEELLERGANIDEARADGSTPLMLACKRCKSVDRTKLLLEHGANPNKRDAFGDTSLHLAVLSGNPDLVHALAASGADATLRGSREQLPIEIASELGNPLLIKAVQSMAVRLGELDEYVLAEILKFLPPSDLCAARCACRFFHRAGGMVMRLDEYWALHGTTKDSFRSARQFELQYGAVMDEWLSPVPEHLLRPVNWAAGEKPHYTILKFVMLGMNTGRSCFVLRVADGTFTEEHLNTIGVDFKLANRMRNGKLVKLQIWDPPYIRGSIVTRSYYRGAHGLLAFYDMTNHESFDSLRSVFQEIERHAREDIQVLIIGTKEDDVEHRQVSLEEATQFASSLDRPHITVSSKTGKNCELALKAIFEMALKARTQYEAQMAAESAKQQPKRKSKRDKDCSVM